MTKPERILLQTLLDSPRGSEKLKSISAGIKKGALLIHPTETIYGIGGACNVPAVKERIFSAKQRPPDQPIILIASERKFFAKLPLVFPPFAERLAQAFWPGLLTLVLPSPEAAEGVAIRVSGHPFITMLFQHIEAPLFSTSANLSGESYVNDPDRIFSIFSEKVDFMIDAGPLPPSLPSTVVKIGNDNTVIVVREGAIPSGQIFKTLNPNYAR